MDFGPLSPRATPLSRKTMGQLAIVKSKARYPTRTLLQTGSTVWQFWAPPTVLLASPSCTCCCFFPSPRSMVPAVAVYTPNIRGHWSQNHPCQSSANVHNRLTPVIGCYLLRAYFRWFGLWACSSWARWLQPCWPKCRLPKANARLISITLVRSVDCRQCICLIGDVFVFILHILLLRVWFDRTPKRNA